MSDASNAWTDALPKESGYYWVRWPNNEYNSRDDEVVRVVDGGKRGAIAFRCRPGSGVPIGFLAGCCFLRINPPTDEASP